MRNTKQLLASVLLFFTLLIGCNTDDSDTSGVQERATPQAFMALKQTAYESHIQNFRFDAGTIGSFTTDKGVQLTINGACLSKNGAAVNGMVDINLVEVFDRSGMLTTHKPTMGQLPNGDRALLISGGAFSIEAEQNGETLTLTCPIQLIVPSNLTGGTDMAMTLWQGGYDDDCDAIEQCDVVWEEITENVAEAINFSQGPDGEPAYYAYFSNFGWTNIDRFYTDNRPKTTLMVAVPQGFNDQNSVVYLSYDGEPNALAYLDTFDSNTQLFSEHYGQIPIGLDCHIIFASTDNGQWQYAIKQATISENGTITISETDLQSGTEAQLTAAITGLP
ncbi:hypothetical protein [Sediminicola luteus]|uniref:Uncharacterized protein n=1 Tax=Sediminicola luteus TaxID=319238 RepID=A0A2A4GDK0_9FLAO|nr:hypothetical protein [Sediminicola luteus]PCE66056.1 hypothetical protein B7P33_01780 [Sediminicola luteus]